MKVLKQQKTKLYKFLEGRTAKYVAHKIGMNYNRFLYLVKRKTAKPTLEEMKKIAGYFGKTIEEIF